LTAKQIRKKLVHKAKIKQDFYKTLEKEGKNLELPTFYHEVCEYVSMSIYLMKNSNAMFILCRFSILTQKLKDLLQLPLAMI
jgi:hypothetical protein